MPTHDATKHSQLTSKLAIRIEESLLDDVHLMARTSGMKVQDFVTSLILEKRKQFERGIDVLRAAAE